MKNFKIYTKVKEKTEKYIEKFENYKDKQVRIRAFIKGESGACVEGNL